MSTTRVMPVSSKPSQQVSSSKHTAEKSTRSQRKAVHKQKRYDYLAAHPEEAREKKAAKNKRQRQNKKKAAASARLVKECNDLDSSTLDVAGVLHKAPTTSDTGPGLPDVPKVVDVASRGGISPDQYIKTLQRDHTDLLIRYSAKVVEASDLAAQNSVLQSQLSDAERQRTELVARDTMAVREKAATAEAKARQSLLRHRLELKASETSLKEHGAVVFRLDQTQHVLKLALAELDLGHGPKRDLGSRLHSPSRLELSRLLKERDARIETLEARLLSYELPDYCDSPAVPPTPGDQDGMQVADSPRVGTETPTPLGEDLDDVTVVEQVSVEKAIKREQIAAAALDEKAKKDD